MRHCLRRAANMQSFMRSRAAGIARITGEVCRNDVKRTSEHDLPGGKAFIFIEPPVSDQSDSGKHCVSGAALCADLFFSAADRRADSGRRLSDACIMPC